MFNSQCHLESDFLESLRRSPKVLDKFLERLVDRAESSDRLAVPSPSVLAVSKVGLVTVAGLERVE